MIIKTFLHQRQFSLHREKSELLKCRVQKKEPKPAFWYQPQCSVSGLRETPALSLFGQSLPSPSFEDVFSVNAWTPSGDSVDVALWGGSPCFAGTQRGFPNCKERPVNGRSVGTGPTLKF